MSELFDDDVEPDDDPRAPARRPRPLARPDRGPRVILVRAVHRASPGSPAFWTDRLWFASVGYSEVFTTLLWTRVAAVRGLRPADGASWWRSTWSLAYRLPADVPADARRSRSGLDRYREAVDARSGPGCSSASRCWSASSPARSALGPVAPASCCGATRVPFGSKDPYFDKDIGFYVFDLPWLHYLVDFVMAIDGGRAARGGGRALPVRRASGCRPSSDRFSRRAQAQLSVLVGRVRAGQGARTTGWTATTCSPSSGDAVHRHELHRRPRRAAGQEHPDRASRSSARCCSSLNVWRRTWLLPSVGLGAAGALGRSCSA